MSIKKLLKIKFDMKKLLLLSFCLFFYSLCYSYNGWKFVYKQSNGYDVYYNFENIKLQNNFIYWSELVNFSESLAGIMSMTVFLEGDCNKLRQKAIKFIYYSEHFGDKFVKSSHSLSQRWVILDEKSKQYSFLKKICKNNIK